MKTLLKKYFWKNSLIIIGFVTAFSSLTGCSDFLEPDEPFGQIPYQEIFEDETTATAAVTSLYAKLRDDVFLTGNSSGIGVQMGLYADELDFYGQPFEPAYEIYTHQVNANHPTISAFWNKAYNLIYLSNAALEGIHNSNALQDNVKQQLLGEALFVRAITHFNLLNLFGDIPYILTTDYLINQSVNRLPKNQIYELILTDLSEAKDLLSTEYIGFERTRANKSAISTLMARVHLYQGNWQLAEMESSSVINNTALYNLEPQLENEFLINSRSAILQFKPKNMGANAYEASTFIFSMVPPPLFALTSNLVDSFDENDLRRSQWIGELSDGNQTFYHAHKYKANTNTGMSMEYSIVFRLAEMYLIRAEARARQNNVPAALQDLNTIRARAGLENITSASQNETLQAVLNERQWELFTEYGHRWFDIKRFELADQILSPLKPGWRETNILLPIPEAEILLNPNLQPQNPGY